MALKEFTYNCRIWEPYPTTYGDDNFFHAVFGKSQPCFDRDSKFRRLHLLNFFINMIEKGQKENLKTLLKTILDREENDIKTCLKSRYSNPQYVVSTIEIPYIAALQNTRLVVFTEDNELPSIYHPEEKILENYPWKVKGELKEVVVHFNENQYTRLQFNRYENPSVDATLEESTLLDRDDEIGKEENTSFYTQKYPKLTGSASVRGILYQIDILTIFLLNATSKLESFRLSTENTTTGKFDDVVIETRTNGAILLQAKRKQNKGVNKTDLLTSSDEDFSLPKYYLSYEEFKDKFIVNALYLCTNTNTSIYNSSYVSKELLEEYDPLYIEGANYSYLKFKEEIITEFKENIAAYIAKHMPDKKFNEDVFDNDCIKHFFSKFRLLTKYPARGDLSTLIEDILLQRHLCDPLQTKNCAKYLNSKMLDWYDNKKGKYLNQHTLRLFLSEFRSNNFCEKLSNFHIHLTGEHVTYPREKRLVHIQSTGSYLLNVIKVYYSLYARKKRYLFISPVEVAEAQMEVVGAFEDASFEVLVACFKLPDAMAEEIAIKLTNILDKFSYKKVILISKEHDKTIALLKEKNEAEFEEVFEDIKFHHLTEESQSRLLKSVTHFFESK